MKLCSTIVVTLAIALNGCKREEAPPALTAYEEADRLMAQQLDVVQRLASACKAKDSQEEITKLEMEWKATYDKWKASKLSDEEQEKLNEKYEKKLNEKYEKAMSAAVERVHPQPGIVMRLDTREMIAMFQEKPQW